MKVRTISAALVFIGSILAVACAPAGPGRLTLPADLALGQISGPGAEDLLAVLKSQTTAGGSTRLSGQLSFTENLADERETVPVTVPAGTAQTVYKPDPFTSRLWRVNEIPTAIEFQHFDFQRVTGEMAFDWQLTAVNGATVDSGRSVVDLNRTFGGFLAAREVAAGPENPARLAEKVRQMLAEEMSRALALDLGREPAPSEIETAPDEWSRKAASLAGRGDWEGAKAQWLKALELNPEFAPALYNLGTYYERQQNPEQALQYYQKAFVANGSPRHRAALTRLTEALARAGRLAD